MIIPDVIVSWPKHLDYPLWRKFIHENRDKFAKVIVVFTDMNTGIDHSAYLTSQFNKDGIISAHNDPVLAGHDWRNIAVRKALSFSDSEWIWFTEQDFFPEKDFWDPVETLSEASDVFGYFQETRLHPCCIFIKRELLNSTSKDFGVVKDKLDHFGLLQKELDERKIPIGIISPFYGYHYNGLSQNMWLLMLGEEPNYYPEKFKEYCRKCLEVKPLHPAFEELFYNYVTK